MSFVGNKNCNDDIIANNGDETINHHYLVLDLKDVDSKKALAKASEPIY